MATRDAVELTKCILLRLDNEDTDVAEWSILSLVDDALDMAHGKGFGDGTSWAMTVDQRRREREALDKEKPAADPEETV